MNLIRKFTTIILLSATVVSCSKSEKIISIMYDDSLLKAAKDAIAANDSAIMPKYAEFINYVDSVIINMEPLSVVKDKKRVAPSKDPRDYITLSPYWWPDSTVEGGVPYIRRDGRRNPEVYEYLERVNSTIFAESVQLLAVAYYLTDNEKYAEKCAQMLRVWFLDSVTGMNPNMTYSQTVPGMVEIRGTGIIDARRIAGALNGAKMIENSPSWSQEDRLKLKDWANSFRYWLENSVNGLKEAQAPNNHGLWYEVTHQAVVMYGGDYDYLRKIIVDKQLPRIDSQMQPDGSFPHELARTLGLHYSTFAMEALSLTDIMAEKVGLNIWDYKAANGNSMLLALEYLKPFWKDPQSWPHMQISPFNSERGSLLLYRAGKRTNIEEYVKLAKSIGYSPDINEKENSNTIPRINSLLYYKLNIE
ncbi:MAG: hypothetical protein CVU13_02635 [Bacteroidetes bacterium HGW-Bacteroidetes-8]|jgi:hypothetical protein|nr:MAG: hypothetical protein CVU13_02635 [Bacteroidetes bacterium HGW-Bacteroidetes-8]